jgi:hypothetical protein
MLDREWKPMSTARQLFEIDRDLERAGVFEKLQNVPITWDEWCEYHRISIPEKLDELAWIKFVQFRNRIREQVNDCHWARETPWGWEIDVDGKTVVLKRGDNLVDHRYDRRRLYMDIKANKDIREMKKLKDMGEVSEDQQEKMERESRKEDYLMTLLRGDVDRARLLFSDPPAQVQQDIRASIEYQEAV